MQSASTELQFVRLRESDSDKEALESSLRTLSTFLRIIVDIAEHYVMDQSQSPNRDVVPIANVIANYRASVAIYQQNVLDHAMTADNTRMLAILQEALQFNSSWWGLSGMRALVITVYTIQGRLTSASRKIYRFLDANAKRWTS